MIKSLIKNIYKVLRSFVFSAAIVAVAFYLLAYILFSFPIIQKKIKHIAQVELSNLTGGDVEMESIEIIPFREVRINNLVMKDPFGNEWAQIKTLAGGLNILKLIFRQQLEFSYAEIIGLNVRIIQKEKGGQLNIQYLIDAFSPKDKDKGPSKFDFILRNVVLRRSSLVFDKAWTPKKQDGKFDANHIRLYDVRGDFTFPRLSNDEMIVDVRRLGLKAEGGLEINKIAFLAFLTPTSLDVKNFILELPNTEIQTSDLEMRFPDMKHLSDAFYNDNVKFKISNSQITPADFSFLYSPLTYFNEPIEIDLLLEGNLRNLQLKELNLEDATLFSISAKASAEDLNYINESRFDISSLEIDISKNFISRLPVLYDKINQETMKILSGLGNVSIKLNTDIRPGRKFLSGSCEIKTEGGDISVELDTEELKSGTLAIVTGLNFNHFIVADILPEIGIRELTAEIVGEGKVKGKEIDGNVDLNISSMDFKGTDLSEISLKITKHEKEIDAFFISENKELDVIFNGSLIMQGAASELKMKSEVRNISLEYFTNRQSLKSYNCGGNIDVDVIGSDLDNLKGSVALKEIYIENGIGKGLVINSLNVTAKESEEGRDIKLESDWIDGQIIGDYQIMNLAPDIINLLSAIYPSLIPISGHKTTNDDNVEFSFTLNPGEDFMDFFGLPFRFLTESTLQGSIDSKEGLIGLTFDLPFLQQGTNKLIYDTHLEFSLDKTSGEMILTAGSVIPVKNGDLALELGMVGEKDNLDTDLSWTSVNNPNTKGKLSFSTQFQKNQISGKPEIEVEILPSSLTVGDEDWYINRSHLGYSENNLNVGVGGIKIWHDNQFIEISGIASSNPKDIIRVNLEDIDVDYIFDTLKINYVTFGGTATGELNGRGVFGKTPIARTDSLVIKNLSYNGSVIGDGIVKSSWDNEEKEVKITADIKKDGRFCARVDGGVWVTQDSLHFDIDADKVGVGFVQPFMQAFSSDVGGLASGSVQLGGTFKDIDLTGKLFADSVSVKLDFTNTYYHGSDSIYLHPGRIEIPGFKLYDKFGNSALFTGELLHNYFHEPRFNFRVSDIHNLLCYDTNSSFNPDWYGMLFGDGSVQVRGWPGLVIISVDMAVVDNSSFTFVLNETEAAEDYHFLTFTDKRKEAIEIENIDIKTKIINSFKKRIQTIDDPSRFSIDIRASVSPSLLVTLVMDPSAGDKITARGNGAIQIDYESDNDEMLMYGNYRIDEGNYNFSLQELILRNFTITPGSTISFNGDPLKAFLDISATYRVNTNLADLDKSFTTDRDLARTNVPVDAVLKVNGDIQSPTISFDVALPTLTEDVERKVKSIISTEDMMSRQIIYLLALNRFYTPDYMGNARSGGELTSVAASTISSQISNMLGHLTDKFSLSPTFRSDKGDFSDLEFDVALSSRLLNNRLLVNGNLGYRDKSNSSTTFIGDFDIEYLLNPSGNLRLKAYNHFNDQNYYLREALTTQGLGIIYQRDFNNPFTFLKPRKRDKKNEEKVKEMESNIEKEN